MTLLLLSAFCSKRIENWPLSHQMYQIYVADFRETGSIEAKSARKDYRVHLYLDGNFIALAPDNLR